jgi:transposase
MPARVLYRRIGDFPAVYLDLRSYRDDSGRPRSDRVCIGKQDPVSQKLIPNKSYYELVEPMPFIKLIPGSASLRHVGASFLIGRIMDSLGLTETLAKSLGSDRARLLQTAVLYMVARDNVFENVSHFCNSFMYSESPINSQLVSSLFGSITFDERMSFFQHWIPSQNIGPYLAYDVTSFSTCGNDIANSEYGYNRDDESLPQINMGCFISETTGLPVFYTTYQGSIADKSHLPCMMACNDDFGISDVCYILDRGFCSTANVQHMTKKGFEFVIGVERRHKTTRMAIYFSRQTILSMGNRTGHGAVHGVSSKRRYYGANCTMHVYYDPNLAEDQRAMFARKIASREERLAQMSEVTKSEAKLFKPFFKIGPADENGKLTFERDLEKINERAKDFGFFCILTNRILNKTETLEMYRRRDVIEKGFGDIKNYVHIKRLRTHNSETTDGKMFCAFISLIVTMEIGVKLGEFMKARKWSKDSVIKELENIAVLKAPHGKRLMNPVTKTQKEIFQAFGLRLEDLEDYILIEGSKSCSSKN